MAGRAKLLVKLTSWPRLIAERAAGREGLPARGAGMEGRARRRAEGGIVIN